MIEIVDIRPPGRPQDAAIFDVQIGPHLRIFNLILHKTPDGRLRTMAPKAQGKHSASFHPELAENITAAAAAAMRGKAANADPRNAA